MKRIFIFFLFFSFLFLQNSTAQLIIPKFNTPDKLEALSSDAEEGMIVPFNEGKSIYFERTYAVGSGVNTKIKRQDVWITSLGKKGWEKPYRLFKADYLKGENFIIGASDDGKRIYLFSTEYTSETESISRLIYMDNTGKDKWTEPAEIKIPGLVFDERYFHFYMNNEGNILLISMSPSKSKLDEDLYVSILDTNNGKWGEMINLGKTINTGRFEVAPYLSKDTKTLYFSSNGHGGFGSADVFISRRLDDSWEKWSKPLNLGEPINSDAFDAYFVMANSQEVFFTSSRNSDHINIFKSSATGEVIFANADSVGGQFYFKGLPAENVILRIEDENGNLIDEIVTGAYGKFHYVKLDDEQNYLIKLSAEDNTDYVGSKVYFVNEEGEKTERYILTEDGIFVNERDIKESAEVKGIFSYKELPNDNIGLVVLDENGFPMDTVYTDQYGNFSFSVLKYDGSYSIIPLELNEEEWKNVQLYISDIAGDMVKPLEFKKGKFIHEEGKGMLIAKNKVFTPVDKEEINGAEIEIAAWTGMADESKVIYFGFNDVTLIPRERDKLSTLISILTYDKSRKVTLIGHTDSVGADNLNITVGLKRAKSVQNHLVRNGVGLDQVKVDSEGENNPAATNDTREGKAKNRRVVIKIK